MPSHVVLALDYWLSAYWRRCREHMAAPYFRRPEILVVERCKVNHMSTVAEKVRRRECRVLSGIGHEGQELRCGTEKAATNP